MNTTRFKECCCYCIDALHLYQMRAYSLHIISLRKSHRLSMFNQPQSIILKKVPDSKTLFWQSIRRPTKCYQCTLKVQLDFNHISKCEKRQIVEARASSLLLITVAKCQHKPRLHFLFTNKIKLCWIQYLNTLYL